MRKFGDALSEMMSKVLAKFGLVSRGKTFYVHYAVGQDGIFDGLTPDQPFKTLDWAVGKCEANKGYNIVLLEGHNEGGSAVLADLDVAGITIIGQGTGSERPTFDYDNAAATIDIGANDITVKNIILRPSVTAVLKGIDIESGVTGTVLEDIEVVEGESAAVDEFVEAICLTSGNHYTTLRNVKIRYNLAVDHATSAVRIAAASNYLTFDNVTIIGPTAGGGGTALTGGILETAAGIQHTVTGCSITNATTNYSFHANSTFLKRTGNLSDGAPVDTVESLIGADNADNAVATTNVVANQDGSVLERLEQIQEVTNNGTGTAIGTNKSVVDLLGTTGTAATVAAGASATSIFGAIGTNEADATTPFSSSSVQANADGTVLEREEYIQGQVNKIDGASLAVAPTAGSLATFFASGGTALGTPLADSKSLVDALGVNGTATTGVLTTQPGTVFSVTKTVTKAAIVAAGLALTGASANGALQLIDAIILNDGTAVDSAGHGAVVELYSNNANGSGSFLTLAQALLGANVAVGLADGTTQNSFVLESGKIISIKATTEDVTSAGTMDVVLVFRRLAAGATIAAA